jgi:Resolvase, N terminal domain
LSFSEVLLPLTNCPLDESQNSSQNEKSQNITRLTGNVRQKEECMKIGYVRVSKQEQHEMLQIDALKEAGCEKWFLDETTGSRAERKGLDEALVYLRPGDKLVV